ncbi:hypothetical protein Kurepalu1_00020 [Pseudomonas phage vB_PpuP-Kurepalu-1]
MSQVNTVAVTNANDAAESKLVGTVNGLAVKLAEAQAKLNQYLEDRAAKEKFANITSGDLVKFPYGRGESRRELEGQVLARNEDKLKVLVGSGFDTEVLVVLITAVTEVVDGGAVSVEDPREEAEAEERTESAAAQAAAAAAAQDELLASVQIG